MTIFHVFSPNALITLTGGAAAWISGDPLNGQTSVYAGSAIAFESGPLVIAQPY
jgi:hypothetical protein